MSSEAQSVRNGRHDLVAEELEELALDPGLPPGVAFAGQQHTPVDAVDRVQLDPTGVDHLTARVDEVEALDLLGVAAGGREHEDRGPERAPADDGHVALDPRRVPRRREFGHQASTGAFCARHHWMRSQNNAVN